MFEPKVRLSLSIQGADMLSSQECEKNPKESYNESVTIIKYSKGKGKNQKEVKKSLVIKVRKQKLITQLINLTEEAYKYMLSTPTSSKYLKAVKKNNAGEIIQRVWDVMSIHDRLKKHFDLIANDFHAISYKYEILDD